MRSKLIYGTTIFLSAFLLFQVQPIIAKMLLPRFGGSSATWTVCLLFFQSVLLVGYLYSHVATRWLSPKIHGLFHFGILILSALLLPWMFETDWQIRTANSPEWALLGLLGLSVGLPYFVLSTTGPLLQAWLSDDAGTKESESKAAKAAYRLFALSNFGSMLALISYPIIVEPFASLKMQVSVWKAIYLLFAVACAFLSVLATRRAQSRDIGPEIGEQKLKSSDFVLWIGLAASPTILMMAVTSYLTQDVAPIPLLWILPLVLYLLSFILCFESDRWYNRRVFLSLFVIAVGTLYLFQSFTAGDIAIQILIPVSLFSLFAIFMGCHGELARLRPRPRFLTLFYLMTALGGVLGGLFVGFIAPRIFVMNAEYAVGLLASASFFLFALQRDPSSAIHHVPRRLGWIASWSAIIGILGGTIRGYAELQRDSEFAGRNFYGSLRVTNNPYEQRRSLLHGAVVHGSQLIDPVSAQMPTTYYGYGSGVERALKKTRSPEGSPVVPQKVGVIGLGTGTIAAYGRPGDIYQFYEINPLVIEIANKYFTFISRSQAKVDTLLGDARITLDTESSQEYDVLFLDAFSGDAIPVHLLTKEAFGIFLKHIKPNGIMAVHVSNQYLDLAPVVRLSAEANNKRAYVVESLGGPHSSVFAASWIFVMSLPLVEMEGSKIVTEPEAPIKSGLQLWTDDYSSLYSALK